MERWAYLVTMVNRSDGDVVFVDKLQGMPTAEIACEELGAMMRSSEDSAIRNAADLVARAMPPLALAVPPYVFCIAKVGAAGRPLPDRQFAGKQDAAVTHVLKGKTKTKIW